MNVICKLSAGKQLDASLGNSAQSKSNVELRILRIMLNLCIFPPSHEKSYQLDLDIRDLEMIDNIERSSFRKLFGYAVPEANEFPRPTNSDMFRCQLQGFRVHQMVETRIKASLLPVRMYIDQVGVSRALLPSELIPMVAHAGVSCRLLYDAG